MKIIVSINVYYLTNGILSMFLNLWSIEATRKIFNNILLPTCIVWLFTVMLNLMFNHKQIVDYCSSNRYVVFWQFKYFASVYCYKVRNIKVIAAATARAYKDRKTKKNTEIKHNILKILISFSYKNMGFYEGIYIELCIGIHMYEDNVQEHINRRITSEWAPSSYVENNHPDICSIKYSSV